MTTEVLYASQDGTREEIRTFDDRGREILPRKLVEPNTNGERVIKKEFKPRGLTAKQRSPLVFDYFSPKYDETRQEDTVARVVAIAKQAIRKQVDETESHIKTLEAQAQSVATSTQLARPVTHVLPTPSTQPIHIDLHLSQPIHVHTPPAEPKKKVVSRNIDGDIEITEAS